MKLGSFYILLIIIIISEIVAWSLNYQYFNENSLYFQSYEKQLSISSIDQIITFSKKWLWVSYFVLPVIIFLRMLFSSSILYIGIFFTELKVEFSKLFEVALISDFVFIFSAVAKLVILTFFKEVNTLDDLQFQPLSAMELLNNKSVDPIFIYPLSLLNVFELGYFMVLAWLLVGVINEANEQQTIKFGQSLKLVAASYGSGLLLWVLVVMFITLNLS